MTMYVLCTILTTVVVASLLSTASAQGSFQFRFGNTPNPNKTTLDSRIPTVTPTPSTAAPPTRRTRPTPVPIGKWDNWVRWGRCSRACNGGSRARQRFCEAGDARLCPGGVQASVEVERCNTHSCCVKEPTLGPWGRWNPCPVTCGEGLQFRVRLCDLSQCPRGRCKGLLQENRPCQQPCCPVKPRWTKWSRWSSCSATCDGVRTRTRTCIVDRDCPRSPQVCVGDAMETKICDVGGDCCPKEAKWSEWSDFSPCSRTCGSGGHQQRQRTCIVTGTCKGKNRPRCVGSTKQRVKCDQACCAGPSEWSSWSEFSKCCNNKKTRTRTCIGDRECPEDPPVCRGRDSNTKKCKSRGAKCGED